MYNGKEIKTRSTAKVNQTAFGKDKVVKPHIPVDPAGYWNPNNWGKPVTIPSNTITGMGINQPLIGIDNLGTVKPILPGQPLIQFPGNKVTEYPILQKGGNACPPGYVMYKGQCVKWEEPNVQNINKGSGGYDALTQTISINPNVPEHLQDWWMEHEKFHHLQNLAGGLSSSGIMGQRPNPFISSSEAIGAYYDMRPQQVEAEINKMIKENPDLQFIPRDLLRKGAYPGFIGADARIYSNPNTIEGEARKPEQDFIKTDQSMFPMKKNGGISKNYFDVMLSDDEILQYRNGGFVVEDLPKAQDGGNQYFAYQGRPDSYYRKVDGKWQILNSSTNGKFIDIKDPKGERTKLLNAQAYPIGEEATKKLNDWKTSQTSTVNVTVPKLDDLRGGVTAAPVLNIFANPAFMSSEQLQQKAMSMAPTAEGAKWLEMAAAQKRNEEAKAAYQKQQADQARYDRASGAGSSATNAPIYNNQTVAPVNQALPYVMAGTDEKGNATLITQAEKQKIDQEVATMAAVQAALRDRALIEQITGKKLTDDQLYDEEGNWNAALAQYGSPEWQQKIEDQRYKNFQDWEQKQYDNSSWWDKTTNFGTALLSDPILTLGNLTEGKGPLMYQAALLRGDEGGLDPYMQQYARQATNASDYWLNDWVNYINPFDAFADAAGNINAGDYGTAAFNVLTAVPILKGVGAGTKLAKGSKLGQALGKETHTLLDAPLRTVLKPGTMNNAVLQSGESALTKGIMDLNPGKALQYYSMAAAPGAIGEYVSNPTAGNFVNAALLTAGTPQAWQIASGIKEGSRYIKPYAETIRNIARGEAPLARESFKRQDLFRFDTAPRLQQYVDDYTAAMSGQGKLSATRGKYASTVENPDALMYATSAAEPTYFYRFPATKGSARSYNIAQQYGKIEPKLVSNAPLSNYEKGIRLAGERSVLPSAQFEEDLASGLYADLNLSDETIANIRKVTQNPNTYWNEPWYTGNTELQKVMANPRFINRSEYLLPNYPNPADFKLVTNAGDVANTMGTSLATSMRAAAADRFAAERALASQERKIIAGKTAKGTSSEEETALENPWEMNKLDFYNLNYKPSAQFNTLTGLKFQDGGVFEGELDEERIKELERLGFKIEPITERKTLDLKLPHQQETFRKSKFVPYAFVDAFNEGDINNLLLGAGVSGMFDTPLKQLRAGFDINALNITGLGKKGIMYNDFNVQSPTLRLNYNIPYIPKKKG